MSRQTKEVALSGRALWSYAARQAAQADADAYFAHGHSVVVVHPDGHWQIGQPGQYGLCGRAPRDAAAHPGLVYLQ